MMEWNKRLESLSYRSLTCKQRMIVYHQSIEKRYEPKTQGTPFLETLYIGAYCGFHLRSRN